MFLQLRQEFHACKQTSSRCSRNAVFQSSSFYCPGRSPPQDMLPEEVTFAAKSTFELHSWPYAVSLCCSENVEPDNLLWTQLANLFGFSQRHFSSHPSRMYRGICERPSVQQMAIPNAYWGSACWRGVQTFSLHDANNLIMPVVNPAVAGPSGWGHSNLFVEGSSGGQPEYRAS